MYYYAAGPITNKVNLKKIVIPPTSVLSIGGSMEYKGTATMDAQARLLSMAVPISSLRIYTRT